MIGMAYFFTGAHVDTNMLYVYEIRSKAQTEASQECFVILSLRESALFQWEKNDFCITEWD